MIKEELIQMSQIDIPFIALNNKGLEVKNITKSYDNKRILDNVSLDLNRGESVALLGPNGAGKTSLFYITMGLIKADTGSINLDKKQKKIGKVMREFKSGTLKSGGSGKKVTNPKQAIAIALSEANAMNQGGMMQNSVMQRPMFQTPMQRESMGIILIQERIYDWFE